MSDHDQRLHWRGVRDACLTCKGSGVRCYGSTSTWRGGMGGCMMTWDVCDVCWGSGDRYRHGVDLRRLRDEENKRVAERAVDLLAHSCGATFDVAKGATWDIIRALEKLSDTAMKSRKRAEYNQWTPNMANALARTLRTATGLTPRTHAEDDE